MDVATQLNLLEQACMSENGAAELRAVLDKAQNILPPIAFRSLLRDGLIDSIPPAVQHLGTLKFENKIEKLAYLLEIEPINRVDIAMEFKMYCQWDEQKEILRKKAKKWAENMKKIQIDLVRGKVILDKSIDPKEETEANK
ncbi:MAG: hypothetical protein L6R37_006207 [Teloschistes peruensis]|nr:MAG: hypothetical protein L6R37_006207 [Teloschistes peruensis]